MMLLKCTLWTSVLLISSHYVSCDSTSEQPLTKVHIQLYVPYLQDALKWEISDTLKNATDAETVKSHLELVQLRLANVTLLAPANSLMSTTLNIYADVISGTTDVDTIVANHVEKGLEDVLKDEDPENAQKVKQAFVELIIPAMKKLQTAEGKDDAIDEIIEAFYSASVTAETSLNKKDGFKLFRVALAASPAACEKELTRIAENTPKPGDKISDAYKPHSEHE